MLRRVLPLLLVAATLSACDDPSNVGLGLVGGDGGEPVVQHVAATPFSPANQKDFTGGAAFVLAGKVQDPLLGTIESEGYVDFGAPVAVGSSSLSRFRSTAVTGAYLELPRAYLYGDTLSTVSYVLEPVAEEWVQSGAHAESAFPVQSAITTFSYALPDTTVRVELPATWVASADTMLRSTAVATSFHGFRLRATSGDAVIGFEPKNVRLFATTAEDTVVFDGTKSFSASRRLTAPNLPTGYVALQDGIQDTTSTTASVASSFRVDFALDKSSAGLSRLALELAYDSLLTAQTPPNFVRPRLNLLEIVGLDGSGNILATGTGDFFLRVTAAPGADGRIVFTSRRFTAIGRDLLLPGRTTDVKTLLIDAPQLLGTLNAVILYAPGAEQAPRYSLTVVPSE